jgi:hypothetical protein
MWFYIPAPKTNLSVSVSLHSPPILDREDRVEEIRRAAEDKEKKTAAAEKTKSRDDDSLFKSDDEVSGMDSIVTNVDDLLSSEEEEEGEEDLACKDGTEPGESLLCDSNYSNEVSYEDNDIGESAEPHRIWANACLYRCKACNRFMTTCQSQFIRHLKKHHVEMPGLIPYKKVHGEPLTTVKKMKCELCGSTLVQDHEKIRNHLRSRHDNLSVRKYYEDVVKKGGQKQQQQQEEEEEQKQQQQKQQDQQQQQQKQQQQQQEEEGKGEDSFHFLDSPSLSLLESDGEEEEMVDAMEDQMEDQMVDANRETESPLLDEEELELNKYKDWVNKCHIRYRRNQFWCGSGSGSADPWR